MKTSLAGCIGMPPEATELQQKECRTIVEVSMIFEEHIKNTPLINAARAIPIIADLTLIQDGILSSESISNAHLRISKYIKKIMLSTESINKKYFIVSPNFQVDEIEVEYEIYSHIDENGKYMLVNFIELLAEFNKCREQDGLGSIRLSPISQSGLSEGQSISSSALADFAISIGHIVTHIVPRDDLMKAETLESIIDEGLNKITDVSIRTAIPKIRSELRNALKEKITDGRLSNVVDKKIQSAIYLTEKLTGPISDNDRLKYRRDLAKFDLPARDRDHVVDVFIKYKKDTKPE